VWLGWFLSATMHRFGALCQRRGDGASATRWTERAAELRKTTEEVGWDGAWYLRAFHDDGSLVGSSKSRECRIDSLTQSWAVLSMDGRGSPGARALQAVRSAEEHLVRDGDRLVLLFTPPFDSLLHDPGYVRAYPPGVRENGGQYTHAGAWLGLALAAMGDGEGAERTFRLLNPVLRSRSLGEAQRYRLEPYVVAGDIYGAAPWVGRGGWSWYTGSASWLWRLGVEGILGLRKREGRLVVEPCIPPGWMHYEAWVQLGAARVHVVVDNPKGVARGVAEMTLDGAQVVGNRIDVDASRAGTHELAVLLGPPPAPHVEATTERQQLAG
jgi:cyclic beta-1,2-glucan synthetase